jgi:hypothetical protein
MNNKQKGDKFLHVEKQTSTIMLQLSDFANDFILERTQRKYFLIPLAQLSPLVPPCGEERLITNSKPQSLSN